ncbi:MAG: hypothetical protein OEL76_00785 [Siculibacillus sp.]|nr:hypothetical protein [Siculibacillus sp.]
MIAEKFVLAAAAAATIAMSTAVVTAPARAGDPGAAFAAGAAGLVGGLILGNALTQPQPETYVVRRRPVRVYEEEVVVPRRCWREVWYDDWGDRHVRRLCR